LKTRSRQVGHVHAIVPLNILKKSKARLSPILKPAEREQLTLAMLKDVLSALRKAKRIHSVTLVSADRGLRRICKRLGASFLWEGRRRGLNRGVKLAVRHAQSRGASSVLVIHSDLPLLKPQEIDAFVKRSEGCSVALTPSKDRDGTNALLMRPPQVIRPVFGKNSFRKHLSLARQGKVRSRVLLFDGISFDVDTPRDLVNLVRRPLRNETGRVLRAFRKRS
jgi:2-phospho-L-lactate/phosphoenolpyruvate guanylyltransferase